MHKRDQIDLPNCIFSFSSSFFLKSILYSVRMQTACHHIQLHKVKNSKKVQFCEVKHCFASWFRKKISYSEKEKKSQKTIIFLTLFPQFYSTVALLLAGTCDFWQHLLESFSSQMKGVNAFTPTPKSVGKKSKLKIIIVFFSVVSSLHASVLQTIKKL